MIIAYREDGYAFVEELLLVTPKKGDGFLV